MTGPAGNARPDDLADMQTTLSSLLIQKQNVSEQAMATVLTDSNFRLIA